jgi:coproporphyrinogen III oxidase
MTDPEINFQVYLCSEHPEQDRQIEGNLTLMTDDLIHRDIEDETSYLPDYCNNPDETWPIIIENKISLNWSETEKSWCAHVGGVMIEGCWCWDNNPTHYHDDSNPLRAAMIVFLKMNEAP